MFGGLFSFKTDLNMITADKILDDELSDNMLEYLKDNQVFRKWIKDAMYKYADEYHKSDVLKLNKPLGIKSVCDCVIPSFDLNRTLYFKCEATSRKEDAEQTVL